jgi:hypothetical protein
MVMILSGFAFLVFGASEGALKDSRCIRRGAM